MELGSAFFLCFYKTIVVFSKGSPGGSVVKNLPTNAGAAGAMSFIPGEGNSNPLQYSCQDNSMDKVARQVTVHGVAKSQKRLK